MSRIYSSVVIFGVAQRVVCPDPKERADVVFGGKHPFVEAGTVVGLDWCSRDMTGYSGRAEGEVYVYVGRRLSMVDVDVPLGSFTEEDQARAVASARELLAAAGFDQAPTFHHVASHCD